MRKNFQNKLLPSPRSHLGFFVFCFACGKEEKVANCGGGDCCAVHFGPMRLHHRPTD